VTLTVVNRRAISFKGLIAAFAISSLSLAPLVLWVSGVRPPGTLRGAAAPVAVSAPPSIAQVQFMSDLATTRVHLSDFIEGENNHYVGRWTLHGEAVLGVDLSQAQYAKLDNERKRATLRLPQPHMISSKLDHDRCEEIYIKSKVWIPTSSRQPLRDEVWKHADRKIQRLGHEAGYMERAKVQAERVLEKLFDGFGWKVDFEWQAPSEDAPRRP
jgi:hypothetical protein